MTNLHESGAEGSGGHRLKEKRGRLESPFLFYALVHRRVKPDREAAPVFPSALVRRAYSIRQLSSRASPPNTIYIL